MIFNSMLRPHVFSNQSTALQNFSPFDFCFDIQQGLFLPSCCPSPLLLIQYLYLENSALQVTHSGILLVLSAQSVIRNNHLPDKQGLRGAQVTSYHIFCIENKWGIVNKWLRLVTHLSNCFKSYSGAEEMAQQLRALVLAEDPSSICTWWITMVHSSRDLMPNSDF